MNKDNPYDVLEDSTNYIAFEILKLKIRQHERMAEIYHRTSDKWNPFKFEEKP